MQNPIIISHFLKCTLPIFSPIFPLFRQFAILGYTTLVLQRGDSSYLYIDANYELYTATLDLHLYTWYVYTQEGRRKLPRVRIHINYCTMVLSSVSTQTLPFCSCTSKPPNPHNYYVYLRGALLTEVSVWSLNQSSRIASKSYSDLSVIVCPWSLASVSTIDDIRMLSSSGHTMIRWGEDGRRGRRRRRRREKRERGEVQQKTRKEW